MFGSPLSIPVYLAADWLLTPYDSWTMRIPASPPLKILFKFYANVGESSHIGNSMWVHGGYG